jgi:hypothetical protein
MGEYMSTSTGTEKLVQIARTDNDQLGNNGLGFTALVPIPQIPAPAWAATTTRRANDVLLPVNNNAAGDYFVLNTSISCVGGSSEPNPWNQSVAGTQADGECSWTNVGLGLVPTANTTATMTKAGNPVPSVVGATVAADCAKFDANGNLVDAACPAGSTSNSEWSGGTLSTNLSASATNYFEAMGMAAPSATESSFELPIALQTTFSKLSCTLSGTPGGSATYTFTLDTEATQGGTVTASAMTCQVASANQSCGPDNSHNIVVPAGSLVSIAAAPAGTPTARTARCVMQANM